MKVALFTSATLALIVAWGAYVGTPIMVLGSMVLVLVAHLMLALAFHVLDEAGRSYREANDLLAQAKKLALVERRACVPLVPPLEQRASLRVVRDDDDDDPTDPEAA